MARMPGTDWQGERSPKVAMARYDAVCVHTIVGYAPAHAAHFSTKANGQIIQSRDTRYRSGANLEGNHRIIAIENEDHGTAFGSWNTKDGHAVPAMTAAQIEANAQILAWAHKTHGVPLQLCPNSKPSSRGLAYHRQGIDGNWSGYKYPGRVSGGEIWSTSRGKVCPGDRRIAQLPAILARAKQIVNGDDDMPITDADAKKIASANWHYLMGRPGGGEDLYALTYLRYGWWDGKTILKNQAKQLVELAAIKTAVGAVIDKDAVAQQVAALTVPAVVAALAGVVPLTEQQVEDAAEQAIRNVLGTLDES